MQLCINDCFDCHSTCLETIAYCLQKGGKHAEGSPIFLLQDCIETCQACISFLIRDSDFFERGIDEAVRWFDIALAPAPFEHVLIGPQPADELAQTARTTAVAI